MGHPINLAFADRVIAVRSDANFVTPARYEETPAFPVALEDFEWRRFGARILDAALDRFGLTNRQIAKLWCDDHGKPCDESLVRQIRSGQRPLTIEKVMKLPRDAAESFLVDALEQVRRGGGDGDHGTLGREALACSVANGALSAAAAVDDKPAAYMAATELEKAAKRAKAASKGARK